MPAEPLESEGEWPGRSLRLAARAAFLLAILAATLSNLNFQAPTDGELNRRLASFFSLDVSSRDLVDGLRNLLLFAGWGLVWSMTARRLRNAVLMATISGMLISASVETLQLFSPLRQASILDVITNSGGAFAGATMTVAMLRGSAAMRHHRSYLGVPIAVFAAAYCSAAMLEIVLPGLRQELLPGAEGSPFDRLRIALENISHEPAGLRTLAFQTLLMVPAGGFVVAALVESGWTRSTALLLSAAATIPLALLLEVARGTTGQPIEIWMFVAHAAGLLAGMLAATVWLPPIEHQANHRKRAHLTTAAYVGLIALWRWQPFGLSLEAVTASFSANHLMPLQALTMKTDVFSVSVVAVGFLLHVPLGAVFAMWPLARTGWLAHLLPGVWIVMFVEAGQLFVAGRHFDVTDILIGTAGVVTGWALMRRAGFTPASGRLRSARPRPV